MHEFIDFAAFGIRSSGALSKNDVANRVEARIRVTHIDKFPMTTTLLANEQFGNILTCIEALCEVARIGSNSTRCRRKLRVNTCREVDGKREFAAGSVETAGYVSTENGAGVPCVNEKKDGFKGKPDGIVFVGHDLKPFIQVSIDALNKHRMVVVAGQTVVIDVEEVEGLLEHTQKLGVLVEDNCVAKAVTENDAHECRGKCLSGFV